MKVPALLEAARGWLGVPFLHQGRSRMGVDCAGFVICLAEEHGLLPKFFADERRYGRNPGPVMLERVKHYCRPLRKPEPGALILIRWAKSRDPSHVALCAGENLIHCYGTAGRVVEHGFRGQWLREIDSVWWIPGVERE